MQTAQVAYTNPVASNKRSVWILISSLLGDITQSECG